MPDESTTALSLDAKATTFLKKVEDRFVKEFKGARSWARENLRTVVRKRLYVGEHGPIRILRPGSMGEFYPGAVDDEDIMAPLLDEMIEACPPELKMEHIREHEENIEALMEAKRRDPSNWI